MTIETRDGHKFYTDSGTSLIVESDSLDACIAYVNENHIPGIAIDAFLGYRLADISFLKQCARVERICVSSRAITDLSPLYQLTGLKTLIVTGNTAPLDLSRISGLEELRVDWHPKIVNIGTCERLRQLHLVGYKPRSRSLEELRNLKQLSSVTVTKSPITSFAGCEGWSTLEYLEFNYLTQMRVLDALRANAKTVRTLLFYSCKKLENHDYVAALSAVEILAFNNCGTIPSIAFLRDMPRLKDFRFVDTDVADGDLSPCLGLESAQFTSKRHFSHCYEEMQGLIAAKNAKR